MANPDHFLEVTSEVIDSWSSNIDVRYMVAIVKVSTLFHSSVEAFLIDISEPIDFLDTIRGEWKIREVIFEHYEPYAKMPSQDLKLLHDSIEIRMIGKQQIRAADGF